MKLTDFGLSKEYRDTDPDATYSFVGTLEYMAPEIIMQSGHGSAADWWSFGVVMVRRRGVVAPSLAQWPHPDRAVARGRARCTMDNAVRASTARRQYEMLTGNLPFGPRTHRQELMESILHARIPMPNVSLEAQDLLRCFLRRDPSQRLGYNSPDGREVQAHPFFRTINFARLYRREIVPPFVPLHSAADNPTRYFDADITSMLAQDSPAAAISNGDVAEILRGFSFSWRSPNATPAAEAPSRHADERNASVFANALQMVASMPTADRLQLSSTSLVSSLTTLSGSRSNVAIAAIPEAAPAAHDDGTGHIATGEAASSECSMIDALARRYGLHQTSSATALAHLAAANASSAHAPLRPIVVQTAPIETAFRIDEAILGRGRISVVKRCVERSTGAELAVKIIDHAVHSCGHEVDFLRRYANVANILSIRAWFENDRITYIVTELCRGGDLMSVILEYHALYEMYVFRVMSRLFTVISRLHQQNVVHRNLSPSSIMFLESPQKPDSLRIISFDLVRHLVSREGLIMTPRYTESFVPQALLEAQRADAAGDMFALGVIMVRGAAPCSTVAVRARMCRTCRSR